VAIKRAQVILDRLEAEGAPAAALAELPLFAALEPAVERGPSAVEMRLADIDPDGLAPREALELLYALKSIAEKA
jgi:DNA mismatch repair protein MutS